MTITNLNYKDLVELIKEQKQLIRAQDRLIEAQGKLVEAHKAKIELLEEQNDLRARMINSLVRIAKGAEND